MSERCSIGLRARTGEAVVVALEGPSSAPTVVERRTIALLDGEVPSQPFHVASAHPENADEIIGATTATANRLASDAIRVLVDSLRSDGCDVQRAGVVLGSGYAPTKRQSLTQHAAMHAAEGELYRNAVADACAGCGLEVVGAPERDLPSLAASALRITNLDTRLKELGSRVGSPWRREHKLATLAAWLALDAARR